MDEIDHGGIAIGDGLESTGIVYKVGRASVTIFFLDEFRDNITEDGDSNDDN